jgi:hypothetical protein
MLLVAGCSAGLVACGSTSPKSTTPVSPTVRSSASGTSATTAGDEASKSPERILADAASALRSARGYRLQGAVIQGGRRLQVQLLASAPGSVQMTARIGSAIYEVLHVPSGFYLRGNASFYREHFGARGAALANLWIHASSSAGLSELGNFAPATMARCLTEDHGKLSIAGTTSVDGRRAVVLRTRATFPALSPGRSPWP